MRREVAADRARIPQAEAGGRYDVVVVGAGHAGCEAAMAAARLGCAVALVAMHPDAVADLPCNPAIGGPAKGHLVREIDAAGGAMGAAADASAMQVRLLNTGKGLAVQAIRVLVDKVLYQLHIRSALAGYGLLSVIYDEADCVLVRSDGQACGIGLACGAKISATAVVICAGVYLRSQVVTGEQQREEGPAGREPTVGLAHSLVELGLKLGRFKTGTSPRVALSSVDLSRLRPEPGLPVGYTFSHGGASTAESGQVKQRTPDVCWATYTNNETHRVIRENQHRSPLLCGTIVGAGPRHCPSIEDKIVRFPARERHPVFLERESWEGEELYVLGMSTSLPVDAQQAALATLPGLEQVIITRPGYAIEYDFVLPGQLEPTLEAKHVRGLFLAGQVCGTSGYEEAAGLGLIAGVNAARRAQGIDPVVWPREDSYLGVLADDLVTRDITEPYRIMTARAEHRLVLRMSNADLRLSEFAARVGLIGAEQAEVTWRRRERLQGVARTLREVRISEAAVAQGGERALAPPPRSVSAWSLLKRPGTRYRDLVRGADAVPRLEPMDQFEIEAEAKYGGYIRQQERALREQRRQGGRRIPAGFDYGLVPGLSTAARRHLERLRPLTLGQASRVEGVSPADVAVLLGFLRWKGHARKGRGVEDDG